MPEEHHRTIDDLRMAVVRQRATIFTLKAQRHVTKDAEHELALLLKDLAALMGSKVGTLHS